MMQWGHKMEMLWELSMLYMLLGPNHNDYCTMEDQVREDISVGLL